MDLIIIPPGIYVDFNTNDIIWKYYRYGPYRMEMWKDRTLIWWQNTYENESCIKLTIIKIFIIKYGMLKMNLLPQWALICKH